MSFFKRLGKSVYGPDYYQQEVFTESGKRAFGYYEKLILLLALITGLVAMVTMGWPISKYGPDWLQEVEQIYPDDLVIEMRESRLTANGGELYSVSFDQILGTDFLTWLEDDERSEDLPTNLVVFNTGAGKTDLESFETADTLMLVGGESMIYRENNGKVVIQSFSRWPDFTLDKAKVVAKFDRLSNLTPWAVPVFFVLAFIGGLLIGNTVWLLFALLGALLVWLVLFVRGWRVSYGRAYFVTLHLLTVPLIISTASMFLLSGPFSWLSFLVLVLIALANIRQSPPAPAVSPAPSPES